MCFFGFNRFVAKRSLSSWPSIKKKVSRIEIPSCNLAGHEKFSWILQAFATDLLTESVPIVGKHIETRLPPYTLNRKSVSSLPRRFIGSLSDILLLRCAGDLGSFGWPGLPVTVVFASDSQITVAPPVEFQGVFLACGRWMMPCLPAGFYVGNSRNRNVTITPLNRCLTLLESADEKF